MQSSHWVNLLKKLPVETHNQLSVVTMGGTEVMIQAILVMEGECLVIKGRLAACQDTGRLYFVPFDQIDYIGFIRSVGEDEVRAWFGDTSPAEEADAPAEVAAAAPSPSARTPMPSRAALLERVRARTTSPGLPFNTITLPAPPPTST